MSGMRRLALLTLLLLVVAGCSSGGGLTPDERTQLLSVAVTYDLSGSATSADITMTTPTGTTQEQNVSVPLTLTDGTVGHTFTFQAGDFVDISAQNDGDGTLTCTIREGSKVISQNTASGQYAIADCSGDA